MFLQENSAPILHHLLIKSHSVFQIKQNLKEHGMAEDIIEKWRERPDGVAFQRENEKNTTVGKDL